MNQLFCHFEGTSRLSGVRWGAQVLSQVYPARGSKHLQMENQNSAIYCRRLKEVARKISPRLTIGGEHLISFPLIENCKERHADLKLIVLDAHHDAYAYPLSTHYSVFYHLLREFNLPALFLGIRYELDKAFKKLSVMDVQTIRQQSFDDWSKKICEFVSDSPYYLSLDLDVIDPKEFSAVSSPVPGGFTLQEVQKLLELLLNLNPIACDIVEYNAAKDTSDYSQIKKLKPIFRQFYDWRSNGLVE